MQVSEVPYLDERATTIAAMPDDVWTALLVTLDRMSTRPAAAYARLVRSSDWKAGGRRPLAEGSTLPGFRVAAAQPGSELVLEGRHHFSTYALTFRIEQVDAGTSRLTAESRAAFPGLAGRAYRLLVVGSGGHVIAVRRLLASVKRRCGA